MEPAPLYQDVAFGPDGGRAFWVHAEDGTRLRLAHWPAHPGLEHRGLVLLFPGRSEYVEKYGTTARELAAMGYDTLCIDWRGQGLADRKGCPDPLIGHVGDFAEYQQDVRAMRAAIDLLYHPAPPPRLYLLAHSMGGCIGLRALHQGLDVAAAAFTGPMWNIPHDPRMRPLAWAASWLSCHLGRGCELAPGTSAVPYVSEHPFEDNELTTDPDRYLLFQKQLELHPDLALAGPSMRWLLAALRETRALRRLPPPRLPALTFLGSKERIVDPQAIRAMMQRWGAPGRLEIIDGAEHEVLMEQPETRVMVNAALAELFAAHR